METSENEIEKIYFGIAEVSTELGVNASLLRFWEKEFDVIQPRKTQKGDRYYTRADIEKLKLIRHLLKEKGFTIQGAREKLKSDPAKADKEMEMIHSLERVKIFLLDLKKQLGKDES